MIQREVLGTPAAVGSDGSATATATTTCMLSGIVYSVYVDYGGSPPVGTSVVVEGANEPKQPILTLAGNSDQWVHVLHQGQSSADASTIVNQGALVTIRDKVTVTISSTNADCSVSVVLIYEALK